MVILASYCVSAFANTSLVQAMHELLHDMVFENSRWNLYLAYLVNCPLGVALSASDVKYHHGHHARMGDIVFDYDCPTRLEGRLVRGTVLLIPVG